jgi:hypothetical protein
MFRLYWKPEQPPGTTRTRSPEVSGNPSSLAMNFLISAAAVSVSSIVIAGALVVGALVVEAFVVVVADIFFLSP